MFARLVLLSSLACALPLAACAGTSTGTDGIDQAEAELRATRGCQGKRAGDTCQLCRPTDVGCVETAVLKTCQNSVSGGRRVLACRPDATPAAYAPCAGKAAGAACTICDPRDTSCFETMELKVCSAAGVCGSAASYSPCAGKATGATCTICDPADKSCVETMEVKVCSAAGVCGSAAAYNPCAGKATGATCTLCAPGDTTCFETMELKVCNARGECSSSR